MASGLFFLFFMNTMMFFNPNEQHNHQNGGGRRPNRRENNGKEIIDPNKESSSNKEGKIANSTNGILNNMSDRDNNDLGSISGSYRNNQLASSSMPTPHEMPLTFVNVSDPPLIQRGKYSDVARSQWPATTQVTVEEDVADTLVVMGCFKCHQYIMVPRRRPCCPICFSTNLLDIFQ